MGHGPPHGMATLGGSTCYRREILDRPRWHDDRIVVDPVPSLLHEALIALCRQAPTMVIELLGDRLDLPADGSVTFLTDETNLSQLTELDADLVLRVLDARGTLRCALIIEVQLDRKPDKERSWPAIRRACIAGSGAPPTWSC